MLISSVPFWETLFRSRYQVCKWVISEMASISMRIEGNAMPFLLIQTITIKLPSSLGLMTFECSTFHITAINMLKVCPM